jgi:tetratricopeptide (TPR) repeat protein
MSIFLALLLQVGPNPATGTIPGEPDELVNRPPRTTADTPALDAVSQWLSDCLELVTNDPARAHAQASIRRNDTGGAQRVIANHCLGLAATELGRWDEARAAFLEARDETPQEQPRAKARFGAMAGNAALVGGDAASALMLLETARADAREAASATLEAIAARDAARALVSLDRPDEALAALESATRIAPDDGEGWLLKATLLRRLDRLGEAQEAIEHAGALSPMDAEVGLEAGVIAVLSGRAEAARESWQSVIEIQPESLAAETARDYLAQLGPPPASAARPAEEAPTS